jgi:hypothetical protein
LVVLNPTLRLFLDGEILPKSEIQNPNDFKGFSIARSERKILIKFSRFLYLVFSI